MNNDDEKSSPADQAQSILNELIVLASTPKPRPLDKGMAALRIIMLMGLSLDGGEEIQRLVEQGLSSPKQLGLLAPALTANEEVLERVRVLWETCITDPGALISLPGIDTNLEQRTAAWKAAGSPPPENAIPVETELARALVLRAIQIAQMKEPEEQTTAMQEVRYLSTEIEDGVHEAFVSAKRQLAARALGDILTKPVATWLPQDTNPTYVGLAHQLWRKSIGMMAPGPRATRPERIDLRSEPPSQ